MSHSPADCANCPVHHVGNLVRLGVDLSDVDFVVALAGNPNTGKSTVFNALTGLRQHTGNWPGKTVARAEGGFSTDGVRFKLVDLPGTYSLLSTSLDERIARDFILFGRPDVTVVVVDATRLERNLNLALQVLEITDRVVVCLNLVDEARRRGLEVDERRLARDLGVPVVATSARYGEGLDELRSAVVEMARGEIASRPLRPSAPGGEVEKAVSRLADEVSRVFPDLPNPRWVALRLLDGDTGISEAVRTGGLGALEESGARSGEGFVAATGTAGGGAAVAEPAGRPAPVTEPIFRRVRQLRWQVGQELHQTLVEGIYAEAARLAERAVTTGEKGARFDWERTVDRLVTSRTFGFPLMLLLLTGVFWVTIAGANVPSALLASLLLDTVHPALKAGSAALGVPWWLDGLVLDGMYLATAWVVAVMLPPMAIFFPLFTLLEDLGYLPRVAFNMDSTFRRVGAHGKQALTMAMGWGCNAAAIVSTRIIDSPRERLIAIITNNFALCNGRWPTQILIASIFLGGLAPPYLAGLLSATAVVAIAVLGIVLTFAVSWLLSRTVLRGEVSTFHLELPPYRPPRVLQTIYTSVIDRTLIVLWRAVVFALPAGAAIWLLSNIQVAGASLAEHAVVALDPLGALVGLSGIILLAYVIAIPANEIVIPTILMLTVLVGGRAVAGGGPGVMFEPDSVETTAQLLRAGGWTLLMALNLMLFSLIHNPCSTTLFTIWKETRSVRWTLLSALLPLGLGFLLCFVVAQVWRLVAG